MTKNEIFKPLAYIIALTMFSLGIYMTITNVKNMGTKKKVTTAGITLQKLFFECKKHWNNNSTKPCNPTRQEQLDWGLNPKIEVTIVHGRKERFVATAKHNKTERTMQIDKESIVYVTANDCLLKWDRNEGRHSWAPIKELEKECKNQ